MLQYIIVILIGIAVVVFVVKRIYRTFFRKNKPVSPCEDCPGCALKSSLSQSRYDAPLGTACR